MKGKGEGYTLEMGLEVLFTPSMMSLMERLIFVLKNGTLKKRQLN